MAPIDLNLLRAFAAVYETQSFTLAGERLHQPRSSMSRAVTALEASLGQLLFQRTTRIVEPTEEGRALYAKVIDSMRGLEGALADVEGEGEAPSGLIRVTATADVGRAALLEVVNRFVAEHRKVRIEVLLSTRAVDLVRERIDLALRVASSKLQSSGLVARRVGTLLLDLYASPGYLAREGTPRRPEDLVRHSMVHIGGTPALQLVAKGKRAQLRVEPRIMSDDMAYVRETALRDGGITLLPRFLAQADVAKGALVRVLPTWSTVSGTLWLIQPTRQRMPARVSLFRAALLEHIAASRLFS